MECGSSTVSFERMAKVDFSSFIFMENTGLMVRANSGILNVGDMDGKTIAVIAATTNEIAVIKELQRRKLQASLIRVKDRREGMAALGSGTVDGFASDKLLLIGAQNADLSSYKVLPENLSYEPYAIALPRGDSAFRIAVNRGLSQLYSSPQILDIYLKWFSELGESHDLFRFSSVYLWDLSRIVPTKRPDFRAASNASDPDRAGAECIRSPNVRDVAFASLWERPDH